MPDDAYEFLGPDLLAPPPPAQGATASGRELPEAPKVESNELVPTSAAEKFEVKPADPAPKAKGKRGSRSNSNEPSRGGDAKKRKKKRARSRRSDKSERDSGPPVPTFKGQMIFSVIAVLASVGLTIFVLVDGIF